MNKHQEDYVFGMDKDLMDKMKAKYDPESEKAVQEWICTVLDIEWEGEFLEFLKDGQVLCALINKIKPKSARKVSKSKAPFVCRENICKYLNGCKKLGMKETDCFVATDLYDGHNKIAVIDQITGLGSISRDIKSFNGPYLGAKRAKENKREFSEETLKAGRAFVPLQNAGSIAVEKESGTDHIVMYSKAGTELSKSVGGISQQNAGSIQVDKGKGTDHIVKYGKVGQDMGKSVGGISQQNAGSIAVEKEKGTDHIVKYGKVGQDMGESVGGTSQQNAGSIAVEKEKGTDHIVRYGKVGQDMGKSAGGTSQQNAGSIAVEKGKGTDHIVKYGKVGQEMGESVGGTSQLNEGSIARDKGKKLDAVSRALN